MTIAQLLADLSSAADRFEAEMQAASDAVRRWAERLSGAKR